MVDRANPPTLTGNIEHHEKKINRMATALPGPMVFGPGDNTSLAFVDGDGRTLIRLSPAGVFVLYGGNLASLPAILDSFVGQAAITGAVNAEAEARRDGDASAISAAKSYTDSQDLVYIASARNYASAVADNARIAAASYTDDKVSPLQSRLTAAEGKIASLESQIAQLRDQFAAHVAAG